MRSPITGRSRSRLHASAFGGLLKGDEQKTAVPPFTDRRFSETRFRPCPRPLSGHFLYFLNDTTVKLSVNISEQEFSLMYKILLLFQSLRKA
jgi:hypothetical protein